MSHAKTNYAFTSPLAAQVTFNLTFLSTWKPSSASFASVACRFESNATNAFRKTSGAGTFLLLPFGFCSIVVSERVACRKPSYLIAQQRQRRMRQYELKEERQRDSLLE